MEVDGNEEEEAAMRTSCPIPRWMLAGVVMAVAVTVTSSTATAQQRIQLEEIRIETEVPDRVARFFIARDDLHYQQIDEQPSFLPELLQSVEDDPF